MPGRGQHAFECTVDGTLYVFGGAHQVVKGGMRRFEFLGDLWRRAPGGRFEDLTSVTRCPILPTIEPHLASDAEARVYEFGGIQDSLDGTFSQRLYRYDPQAERWSDLTPADTTGWPAGREDHGFVGDWRRDALWLFGGVTREAEQLADLWRYDVAQERWRRLTPAPGAAWPAARELYDLVWDGRDALYLFGGYADASGYLNDFWRYDIPAGVWTDLTGASDATQIPPRSYVGLATDANGVLWLAGGYAAPRGLEGFWEYDPRVGRWINRNELAPSDLLPRATYDMVFNTRDHALYIFGGLLTIPPQTRVYSAETWRLDLRPAIEARTPLAIDAIERGGTIACAVTASSVTGRELTYRWRVDERLLPGATSAAATIGPLCPGRHTVRVTVRDGALADSSAWNVTVQGAGGIEQSVSELVAERTGSHVTLRWSSEGDATFFRLYHRAVWTSDWTFDREVPAYHAPSDPNGDCSYVAEIEGLLPAATYTFRVTALHDEQEEGAEVTVNGRPALDPGVTVHIVPTLATRSATVIVSQKAQGPFDVQLLALTGRRVRAVSGETDGDIPVAIRLDVNGLPRGVYLARVRGTTGVTTQRVVITP
jgi:hypothetical protein